MNMGNIVPNMQQATLAAVPAQATFEVVGVRHCGDEKKVPVKVTCRFDAEELSFAYMGLEQVPPELASCSRLRSLDLSWNDLQTLEHLPAGLQHLDASGNQLRALEGLPRGLLTLHDLPPYMTYIYTDLRLPIVEEINSGSRAAAQRKADLELRRKEILRDWLACCPLVQVATQPCR